MNLSQLVLRNCSYGRKTRIFHAATFVGAKFSQESPKEPSSSSSSGSSGSESDAETQKPNQSDTSTRLNTLLQQMLQDKTSKGENSLKLARPADQRALKLQEKTVVAAEPIDKQVITAVGEVAEALGGNKVQTESELLMKLLNPQGGSDITINTLSDVLKGMKIERDPKPPQSRADQVRSVLQKFKPTWTTPERPRERQRPKRVNVPSHDIKAEKVNLWGAEPLGIFTDMSDFKESPQNKTWQKLHEKDLKLAVTHPPANYFQEMILWTEQGKLWQFPINNELGLEEESKVYFADHVFLEEHLEPWCPPRGPIRRFMELVCVGLSKNSYLTVAAKKEHIEWYKQYFEDKQKILLEVGALPVEDDGKKNSSDRESLD